MNTSTTPTTTTTQLLECPSQHEEDRKPTAQVCTNRRTFKQPIVQRVQHGCYGPAQSSTKPSSLPCAVSTRHVWLSRDRKPSSHQSSERRTWDPDSTGRRDEFTRLVSQGQTNGMDRSECHRRQDVLQLNITNTTPALQQPSAPYKPATPQHRVFGGRGQEPSV